MATIEHEIVLIGPEFQGATFKPEAMARAAKSLPGSLRDTVRMRVFASSREVGRPGRIVEAATNVWFEDVRADPDSGGTRVTALAPALGQAAPQLFQQGVLFEDALNERDTVFDLLGDLASDVRTGNQNSDRFDAPLLKRLPHILKDGVDEVRFSSQRYSTNPVVIDRKLATEADALALQTPGQLRTRVSGVLETVSFGDRAFVLKLRHGVQLRGQWRADDPEPLRPFWGKMVLIEGVVEFRPTGTPLSIVADAIRAAGQADEFWGALPTPQKQTARSTVHTARRNPLAALYGIGADEGSEEEFLQALGALR